MSAEYVGVQIDFSILQSEITKIKFLVYSEAQISLQPASATDKVKNPVKLHFAVNGSIIHTYGYKCLTLDLDLQRNISLDLYCGRYNHANIRYLFPT